VTLALEPMAVALVMAAAPFAEEPIKVLLFSVVLLAPALFPKKALLAGGARLSEDRLKMGLRWWRDVLILVGLKNVLASHPYGLS
jgi:hypothetical protein